VWKGRVEWSSLIKSKAIGQLAASRPRKQFDARAGIGRFAGPVILRLKAQAPIEEDEFMAWPVIVAWIHYASIMLMIASLVGEHLLLKRELATAEARTIQRLDIVYGASAALVLASGILRVFLEKGFAYYNQNIAFHILFGIFIIAALLSIYPTVVFLRWRSDTQAGRGQQLAPGQLRKIQMIMRTEMALWLLAPFFATWMAHGEF
jgi:putative membrane protein